MPNYPSIRLICCFLFLRTFSGVYEPIIKIKCYIKKITYFLSKINAKTLFNLKERTERKMLNYHIVSSKKSIKPCAVLWKYKKKLIFDASNSKVCIQMLRLSKPKGHRKERCLKLKVMIPFNLHYLHFISSCQS